MATPETSGAPKPKSRFLTRDERLQCLTLRSIDWTYEKIAKKLGFTMRQVQTACQAGHPTPKKRPGRPKKRGRPELGSPEHGQNSIIAPRSRHEDSDSSAPSSPTMVKPLSFKGDKRPKKRKRAQADDNDDGAPASKELTKATSSAAPAAEDDDSWVTAEAVSDISGPITFVLPTDPASFLGCDANGTVFTSNVENMVESDASTAEPHDVRQVWIANRVAGTESFSFKGHHGKYLGCDKFGVLSAHREAISPEESFLFIPVADNPGTFAVQTQREKFITTNETKDTATSEVRGDSEDIDFKSTFRIRMQARFKPRPKTTKEQRAAEKISRKELEDMVGRRLEDDEVKKLKRSRRDGNFHEVLLDIKVKGKHDKFA